MATHKQKKVILAAVFGFSFLFRLFLMNMNGYPPGADIGLHESVIKSISGDHTNFFFNYYHMGSGLSVTNPGYHIFLSYIIAFTGLPDFFAQSFVASMFSALTSVCAYLITRQVLNERAGLIAAFLLTFSAGDIAILSWSGYPNILTLMLIPLIFYIFIIRQRMNNWTYYAIASILSATVFLTHIFSGLVLTSIIALTIIFNSIIYKSVNIRRNSTILWMLPIFLGVLLVSPYLFNTLPVYFSSQGAITGTVNVMKQAVLETRIVPITTALLSIVPIILFSLLSKLHNKKFLTIKTVFFTSWILLPAIMTQSHYFGFYLDYDRFLYFLSVPVIICISLVIASTSGLFSRIIKKTCQYNKNYKKYRRAGGVILISCLILIMIFCFPIFKSPSEAIREANGYQVMNASEYEAIEWIRTNTPKNSVFVANPDFGWWLSGFSQRPTLSASDPQYLILSHEFEPADVAKKVLDTNYLIDNGIIQIKQDEAYASGNSHELLADLPGSYFSVAFFLINDSQISIIYRGMGNPQQLSLSDFNYSTTSVQTQPENASFIITRENDSFKLTEEITLFSGVRFAKVSMILESKIDGIVFDWLHFPFISKGVPVDYSDTVAIVDTSLQTICQIIPGLGDFQVNPNFYELVYNLQGKTKNEASFYVGFYQYGNEFQINQIDYLSNVISNNTRTYLDKVSNTTLRSFDYKIALKEWNVSYIAVLDTYSIGRFSNDPMLGLVFKNEKISIFKINNYS